MLAVTRYCPSHRAEWDRFVTAAKNGLFIFRRDYMDYHAERFTDHSLMIYEDGNLAAVLPANVSGDCVTSHAGLTFGGLLTNARMTAAKMLAVFDAVRLALKQAGATQLVYKPVPHIFHAYPAEEDLYALFRLGAKIVRRDLASVLRLEAPLRLSKGRAYAIKRARKAGLRVEETRDVAAFMTMLREVLQSRHNAVPTHTADELGLLMERFPDEIKIFGAFEDRTMLAGAVIYDYGSVIHTQYLANSDAGRSCGALDLVVEALVEEFHADRRFLSFGTSAAEGGVELNDGLVAQKEMFGARAIAFDRYELAL